MPILLESKGPTKEDLKKCPLDCGCLKIIGETEPNISNLPIVTRDGISNFYVYEYWWELNLLGGIDKKTEKPISWSKKLTNNDAILIQIFFHTNDSNYSVRALTGTIKAPPMTKKCRWDRLMDMFLDKTGSVTELVGEIGEATKKPEVKLLSKFTEMISELSKEALPKSHAYPWYVKMITTIDNKGRPLGGFEWSIGRNTIRNLGNRLVGGIGLMFYESSFKKGNNDYIKFDLRARLSFKPHPLKSLFKKAKGCDYDLWIPCNPNDKTEFEDRKFQFEVYPRSNIFNEWR